MTKDLKKVPEKVQQEKPPTEKPEETSLKKTEAKTDGYSLEIIRDYYGMVDPFYLSQKDPNFEYCFLRDDRKNISIKTTNLLFQKGGWQICPRQHLLKIGIKETDLSADGLLRRGDTILAFIPKKYHQEKDKYKLEQANMPMTQIKRMMKEGNSSIGGKEIHETMKGIQTAKELGMK